MKNSVEQFPQKCNEVIHLFLGQTKYRVQPISAAKHIDVRGSLLIQINFVRVSFQTMIKQPITGKQ